MSELSEAKLCGAGLQLSDIGAFSPKVNRDVWILPHKCNTIALMDLIPIFV